MLLIFIFILNKLFFEYVLYSTAVEETIIGVFINRYRTLIIYLAPDRCIEDFSSRTLCLRMKI